MPETLTFSLCISDGEKTLGTTSLKARLLLGGVEELYKVCGINARTEVVRCFMELVSREVPSAVLKLLLESGFIDEVPVELRELAHRQVLGPA